MRVFRLGLLLSLLFGPPCAWAGNTADEADVAFELGNEAYARREYVQALRSYFASYRLVPNRNVLFNIARCYEALGRYNEAYRYYHDLALEDLPEADATKVNHSLTRLRPKVALVRVTTEPPGAEVLVDREDLGSRGLSPQTLALPPGAHTVVVHKKGYRRAEATIQLTRGQAVVQAFTLELITGTVRLSGTPGGAEVRASPEGPVLGQVPGDLRFTPGPHVLHVSAPGHVPAQLLVDVPADDEVTLGVALAPREEPTGRLIITANRDNASVRVDGRPAGFTPTVLTLPHGEHTLEVESPNLSAMRQGVYVVANQETRIHAELRYLPPSVRAASKNLVSVDEAPASTTVITQEELRAFGYTTLAEALAAVRGIFVSDDRTYTYLGVRGFAPPGDFNTRILTLWDGHPLNDMVAGQGHVARDLAVDLEEVERIEVVRGPGSALYGTGAFFAVINVVPRDTLGGDQHVEVTAGAGALGTTRLRVTTAWESGPGSFLLSGAWVGMRGAEVTRLGEDLPAVVGLDGERAATASLRARLGGLSFHAQLHGRTKESPVGPFGTELGVPGTRIQDVRGFAEVRYDKQLGERVNLSLRGAYDASRYQGYWMYSMPTLAGERLDTDAARADWLSAETRLRLRFRDTHHFTLGLEGQAQLRVEQEVDPLGSSLVLSQPRGNFSAYVLDEWRLHPRLSLSAGLRVDRYFNNLKTLPFTPRLALIGRPYARGLTKLVVGSAFRAPTPFELDYQDNGRTQIAAGTLEPETISTLELEHAHNLTDELRLTVAGYANKIRHLVALSEQPGPPQCTGGPLGSMPCIVFVNRPGETSAFGAEAGLRWQPGRFMLVDLNYSFVTLVNAAEEEAGATPTHLASGRLLLPLADGNLRLATQATYQSARGRPSDDGTAYGKALLLDVGLSGELPYLRYFAGVRNLLDTQYALALGDERAAGPVPQYGRTFTLQISGSF
ncbi:TonB-dependent receptor [Cystobacter fuscus DSM 2262]|uniref:TonB-dependent receptor n=1 Tax=Cystobacter fuscus (strain ATCC 25194 / DSM 2262 / NBRC 100088 / M29) TaxID=1242864 RepID=S9PA12_CYSF2|nr:TonB-dependent receptor [Cystobacter fuscus]EPX59971.1 TonB-dependent receptor [Cystobacter fuscus DSM 2262]